MGVGAILASIGVLLVVGAYVFQPFRRLNGVAGTDAEFERLVEAWVKRARPVQLGSTEPEAQVIGLETSTELAAEPILGQTLGPATTGVVADLDSDGPNHFCPYCGRRVEPDHVFCPKCGRQLIKEDSTS